MKNLSRIILAVGFLVASTVSSFARDAADYPDSVYTENGYVHGQEASEYTDRQYTVPRGRRGIQVAPVRREGSEPSRPSVQAVPEREIRSRRTSPEGREFIKKEEGRVLYIYDDLRENSGEWRCRGVRGTLTIGYGHTSAARGEFDFTCGARVTAEQAERLLTTDLGELEDAINERLRVNISQNQFDSIVSLGYNCGTRYVSRVTDYLNRGHDEMVRSVFRRCVTAKGVYLQGLADRRKRELAVWARTDHTDTFNAPVAFSVASEAIPDDYAYPERHPGTEPVFWYWFLNILNTLYIGENYG